MKINENISKIIIVAVGVVAFFVISHNFVLLAGQDNNKWELFINHTCTSLDVLSNDLNNLIVNKPQNEELEEMIMQTKNNLLSAHHLIQNGHSFLDQDIQAVTYFNDVSGMLYGVNISGNVNVNILPFAKDGKLSEEEISLLKVIKEDIDKSLKAMYSKESNQENDDLSISEFNKIVSDNFNKSVVEIYLTAKK